MANVDIVYYEYSNYNICFWYFDGYLFCKLIEETDAGDQSTPGMEFEQAFDRQVQT